VGVSWVGWVTREFYSNPQSYTILQQEKAAAHNDHEFLIVITNERTYFIFEKMSSNSNEKSCNVSGASRIDSQFCPLGRASLLTHDVTLSKVWKKLKTSSGTHADGLPMMA